MSRDASIHGNDRSIARRDLLKLIAAGGLGLICVESSPSAAAASSFDWRKYAGQTIRVLVPKQPGTDFVEPLIPEFEQLTGIKVNWEILGEYSPFETFSTIFPGKNVGKESYFDKMTHFDFKTLLPGLLQVEDRMSMAHGLESRVPFLDHEIVEFAATMPSDIKFKDGTLKKILLDVVDCDLPEIITGRKNKMGFPVPLNEWLQGELKDFILDIFSSGQAKKREYFNNTAILESLNKEPQFGRKLWGLLSLELWHKEFHDKQAYFKQLQDKGV
jgi:hypothetical protein